MSGQQTREASIKSYEKEINTTKTNYYVEKLLFYGITQRLIENTIYHMQKELWYLNDLKDKFEKKQIDISELKSPLGQANLVGILKDFDVTYDQDDLDKKMKLHTFLDYENFRKELKPEFDEVSNKLKSELD